MTITTRKDPKTGKEQFFCSCDVCGGETQVGPHRYEGRQLPRYQIFACNRCLAANHDGWAPHHEKRVTAKLLEQGLPIPDRNAGGYLPVE